MEKKEIFFDFRKARMKLILGIISVFLGLMFLPGILKIFGFFMSGSLVFFSKKAISSDVQLSFENQCVYLGFDSKKTYHRQKIKTMMIKRETVDFRQVDFLDVVRYVKVRGKLQTNMKSYPIEFLDIKKYELQMLIDEFLDIGT